MATPQKIRCQVQQIIDHGDHVYTVDLAPERPVPRFKPGQFLHLTLDDYDPSGFWPESRVFSIASSPAQRDRLRISYSVKGSYTTRMEKELHPGRQVWVKLPYGDFVIQEATGDDIVLLAGGTGITAFVSFIAGIPAAINHRVFLAYGARKLNLLLYREIMDCKASVNNGFQVMYFLEDIRDDCVTPAVARGCVSIDAIWCCLEHPSMATFYIAGPPAMIRFLTDCLRNKNVSQEKIRVDAWE